MAVMQLQVLLFRESLSVGGFLSTVT